MSGAVSYTHLDVYKRQLVGRVKGQENRRAMVQIKNNLAERGHGKSFVLSDGVFWWQGNYDITEDELVGGFVPKSSKQEEAKEMLLSFSNINREAVSYTHLDVYKRQI